MSTLPRPPQTTFLAGVVIGGGVLVVLNAFDVVSRLRTLEVRDALADEADGRYSGLGLDVSDLQTLLHVTSMVTAGCAVAMAILAWFVLQRSHSARIGLAVLAVPLTISTFLTLTLDLVAPVMVMASVMLWLQPSRDWFNGVAPKPAPEPEVRPTTPAASPSYPVPAGTSAARPVAGFGTATSVAPAAAPVTDQRPSAVLRACVLTWGAALLVAVGGVWTSVGVARDPEPVLRDARDLYGSMADDMTKDLVVASMIVLAVGICAWCIGLAVIAWLALRRASWARVTLIVGTVLTGVWCLLGFAGGDYLMLVPLVALAVATSSLARPEVRQWYAARGTTGS